MRIEAQIAANRLLMSDFDLWHFVLNNQYLASSILDDEQFDARKACASSQAERDDINNEMRQSWRRIFDLDWTEPDFASPREEKRIQAVLWDIAITDVVRVTPFFAR